MTGAAPPDYVAYHSAEAMGYPASAVRTLTIVTNKRVAPGALGARVWLVAGEGRPRRYYLRGWFTVDTVESGADEGYRTRVHGTSGALFRPMRPIDGEPWFDDFRRSQGSFAFGFQRIADRRFVRALERAAARAAARAGRGG